MNLQSPPMPYKHHPGSKSPMEPCYNFLNETCKILMRAGSFEMFLGLLLSFAFFKTPYFAEVVFQKSEESQPHRKKTSNVWEYSKRIS